MSDKNKSQEADGCYIDDSPEERMKRTEMIRKTYFELLEEKTKQEKGRQA